MPRLSIPSCAIRFKSARPHQNRRADLFCKSAVLPPITTKSRGFLATPGGGPIRTTSTRPYPSPRSEALECVQLAAAFPSASLLAAWSLYILTAHNRECAPSPPWGRGRWILTRLPFKRTSPLITNVETPVRKLACGSFFPQAVLRGSPPPPRSLFAFLPRKHESQPASWLGQKRQQAARTPKLRSVCHKGGWRRDAFQSLRRCSGSGGGNADSHPHGVCASPPGSRKI